jgi:hypothetical protein
MDGYRPFGFLVLQVFFYLSWGGAGVFVLYLMWPYSLWGGGGLAVLIGVSWAIAAAIHNPRHFWFRLYRFWLWLCRLVDKIMP